MTLFGTMRFEGIQEGRQGHETMTADYQMYIWPAACTDATKHLAGRRYPLTNAELKEARRLGMTPSAFVIAREVTRAKDAGPSLDRKPPVETRTA